ncbi:hypothetical protein HAX54_025400, partial [Datura stramonium]|nr:hypothetical protein [Datura stramonium]
GLLHWGRATEGERHYQDRAIPRDLKNANAQNSGGVHSFRVTPGALCTAGRVTVPKCRSIVRATSCYCVHKLLI